MPRDTPGHVPRRHQSGRQHLRRYHSLSQSTLPERLPPVCIRSTRMVDRLHEGSDLHRNRSRLVTSSPAGPTSPNVGRTSVTVKIRVEAERHGEVIHVTDGEAIYVAVDNSDKPIPLDSAVNGDERADISPAPVDTSCDTAARPKAPAKPAETPAPAADPGCKSRRQSRWQERQERQEEEQERQK